MSWRIVSVSSLAKLDYKMDYLVVRTQEEVHRVHLSEIAILIVESTAVSLTAYLLCELAKRKIDVLFCDEKRFPYGLHALLSEEEMEQFCKEAAYRKLSLLLIEGFQPTLSAQEKMTIIDKDLCIF